MLTELSLFSGIGGGLLGSKLLGWRAVGYVEWDKFCCRVLEQRIRDGILEDAPIFNGDIREFIAQGYAGAYSGLVDIVTGGPPCQGFSEAGKKLGKDDPRNMVPSMLDVVEIVQPAFVLIENAPSRAFRIYARDYILPRLAALGFDAAWGIVSAEDAIWAECYPGVPAIYHERKRTWILAVATADAKGIGCNSRLYQPESGRPQGQGSELALSEAADIALRRGDPRRAEFARQEWSGASYESNHKDADSDGNGCTRTPIQPRSRRSGQAETDAAGDVEVADACMSRCSAQWIGERTEPQLPSAELCGWWASERELVRLVHGLPNRVDRVKTAGNAQVPAVVRLAWELLTGEME